MSTATADVLVCTRTFTCPHGDYYRGMMVRATDPAVTHYPEFFLPGNTPQAEWGSDLDPYIDKLTEIENQRRQEEQAAFEAACRANPQKLDVDVLELRRDVLALVLGVPTLVRKGSRVLATDPLALEYPNDFKAV